MNSMSDSGLNHFEVMHSIWEQDGFVSQVSYEAGRATVRSPRGSSTVLCGGLSRVYRINRWCNQAPGSHWQAPSTARRRSVPRTLCTPPVHRE